MNQKEWLSGEQEMKQWVQRRLQTVPATWNHNWSSEVRGTDGAAAIIGER